MKTEEKLDSQLYETTHNTELDSEVESAMWAALGLDDLQKEIMGESFSAGSQLVMGTGHTVNACFMCSTSSNTTAGCNTCC